MHESVLVEDQASMHALMHESVLVHESVQRERVCTRLHPFTSSTPAHLHSLALLLARARALSPSLSRGVAARSLQGKDGVCGGLVEG
jgi:hypothetical protein